MSNPVLPTIAFSSAQQEARIVRVFLSSTFRDFMEERDLLVKQVFPELRRKSRERGVEVVDVDLRWGITEEESRQGKVIPICLGEIDRCRPYFVGMLGERYGWIPPADQYSPEVIERQPWLNDHLGGVSVTELEILHGVLNDPAMAGRAFFYFRDSAWSTSQSEPGFVCETTEEAAKLVAVKQRIRASGFPVAENLPYPKALADQIGRDLWELIEQQFPDLDQADSLEIEARKHASYRQSRLGVYLGKKYVDQLETLVSGGKQKILITGESGAGKSALIANWMQQHQLKHPEDVMFAHHLGCSNDANEIRAQLGRLLETASTQLREAELITEQIQVPQDWWELTAKVAETMQDVGRWCFQTGHRWIWVLDGLDRLAEEDQQALPWLPLLFSEGVSVIISALNCPAKAILLERQFQLLKIGPLQRNEQVQLIEAYLAHYTKKLDADRLQQILACDLARSPLFLRVLLEELRQCGRFETLKDQIDGYIRPKSDATLAVDDLYARVLERLEYDCGVDVVRKVMVAMWASRAGLSESELLRITGLAPLQWAPINLALAQAFGRNGNRLVFDHDFLRMAVRDRYLPTAEMQRVAHSALADCFLEQKEWNWRKAEELPWQLKQSDRIQDLRSLLLNINDLHSLATELDSREVINYWLIAKAAGDGELDELLAEALDQEMKEHNSDVVDQVLRLESIAALLEEAGLYRKPLLEVRQATLLLTDAHTLFDFETRLNHLRSLANTQSLAGNYNDAMSSYSSVAEEISSVYDDNHPEIHRTNCQLGALHRRTGNFTQAIVLYKRSFNFYMKARGMNHPDTLASLDSLGLIYGQIGKYARSVTIHKRCLKIKSRILGPLHMSTLISEGNLGNIYWYLGKFSMAKIHLESALQGIEKILGPMHPDTLTAVNNLGNYYREMGQYKMGEDLYLRSLEGRQQILGDKHPLTLSSISCLAGLYSLSCEYLKSERLYRKLMMYHEDILGVDHIDTLNAVGNLGDLYLKMGKSEKTLECFERCLEANYRVLGPEHPQTLLSLGRLAQIYRRIGRLDQARTYFIQALKGQEEVLGPQHRHTLATLNNLALLYKNLGDYDEAEKCYQKALSCQRVSLGSEHPDTLSTLGSLGLLQSDKGDHELASEMLQNCLEAQSRVLGPEHADTITTLNNLGTTHYYLGDIENAQIFMGKALSAREKMLGEEHPDTFISLANLASILEMLGRYSEAIPLRRRELAWTRQQNGENDESILSSINALAIDLREIGELQEAEQLFLELVSSQLKVLQPEDFQIGRAMSGLANTLELAGKLQEALQYRQATLEHRLEHRGADDYWTNQARLKTAELLHMLKRTAEALQLLDELEASMTSLEQLDDSDLQLINQAEALIDELKDPQA
jgi:tetratricopeptide (TPR) repeat protein